MKVDFNKFNGVLPYASELYGIYQPLLGWKSELQKRRLVKGVNAAVGGFIGDLVSHLTAQFEVQGMSPQGPEFALEIARPSNELRPPTINNLDSIIARRVMSAILAEGIDKPDIWKKNTDPPFLQVTLQGIADEIRMERQRLRSGHASEIGMVAPGPSLSVTMAGASTDPLLEGILRRESLAAGVLAYMNSDQAPELMGFLSPPGELRQGDLSGLLDLLNPAKSDLLHAVISPIGIVHVFRQYFFEFDTFLGPAVQHLWLSPGGTVELVEVSTRKTIVERTTEQAFETTTKTEKSTTTQDELSDAIREENSSNTKLGISVNTSTQFGNKAIASSQISTGTSFELQQSQKEARERTHKIMRQQTEKLSTEIRKSFKSTFKTVTETTDTTSKRYVIQNTTDKLVNYELRRKMRQVGVQVQDYGTQLCWQAYVDNPGDQLGIALFVHHAELPDLRNVPNPDLVPQPKALIPGQTISYGTGKQHIGFRGFIYDWLFHPTISIVPPKYGYIYDHADVKITSGEHWNIYAWPSSSDPNSEPLWKHEPGENAGKLGYNVPIDDGMGSTEPSVIRISIAATLTFNPNADYQWSLEVTPLFRPSKKLLKEVSDANKAKLGQATEEKKFAFQEALFKAARERVKLASNIQPRPFADLREEERIVVYRKLIEQLLNVVGLKVTDTDTHLRHVFSELVQSMFDVDKMLYFVAPDWWMPRERTSAVVSRQGLGIGEEYQQSFGETDVVSWGGAKAVRANNYYITEDSVSAKLGSSLGWLLQLDGDNFRNAFLNAPWVKTVIPIRPSHEWKAFEWLSTPQIEGSDGLDALYQPSDPNEKSEMLKKLKDYAWSDSNLTDRYRTLDADHFAIQDAIRYLILVIQKKQADEWKRSQNTDYLPTDKVYEHGFDPLTGGFQAQGTEPFGVFDQWVEILPTDQIVPVEVRYDPKTGLQI